MTNLRWAESNERKRNFTSFYGGRKIMTRTQDALSSYTKNKYDHMCDVKKIANISFKLMQK